MTTTAPIILFVYNRLSHTQQVVAALKENLLSAESELYIYADAAKNVGALQAVNELRNFLTTITGFKSVHICLRETNLGVDDNIILGVTEVISIHGKAIVLEDDLVTSPWFLKFMNEALDFYENQDEVASIHGYVYPVQQKLKEVFFIKGADCWGWATWKRAWDLFEHDGAELLEKISTQGLQKEFDFEDTYLYFKALEQQAIGHTKHWDIRWYASAFLSEKLTLYPGRSLVKNIGHDASGTHCGHSNSYDVTLSLTPLSVETEVIADQQAYHIFADFMRKLSVNSPVRPKGIASRLFKQLKTSISRRF